MFHATLITMSRKYFFKIGKNGNFDYKINENCPIGITKIGKKWKMRTLSRQHSYIC